MKKQNIISIAICTLLLLLSVTFFSAAAETLTEAGKLLAQYDLNKDGAITIGDVTALLDYLATGCGHKELALPDKEASCTETGTKGGSACALCGEILKTPEILPIVDHSPVTDEAVAPSCKETGLTEGSHCETCGEVLVAQETVAATGHSYANDICAICGKERTSEGLVFVLSEDESYYIVTSIGECTDSKLIIPATYLSKPVKEIGASAFEGCSAIEEAVLPDSITFIGDTAFFECVNLKTVTLPKTIASIESYTFCDCTALKSIIIPDSVTYIDSYAFSGCTALESITLSSDLESIGTRAFEGCEALTNLTLPEGLTTLNRNAFADCTAITRLVLPESLIDIKANAFSGCDSLAAFFSYATQAPTGWGSNWKAGCDGTVYFANEWSYVNGIPMPYTHEHTNQILAFVAPTCTGTGLTEGCFCPICNTVLVPQQVIPATGHIEKDGLCTVCGTADESTGLLFTISADGSYYLVSGIGNCADSVIVIPTKYNNLYVRGIASYAFEGNTDITAVILHSAMRTIEPFAFYQCENLKKVVFKEGLVSIGDGAFAESGVEEIYLPEGLTTLGMTAFCDCTSLSYLSLPSTLETISAGAFGNCSSLKGIVIPQGVLAIDFGAFEGCTGLENVLVASSVTTLGPRAFYECTALSKITLSEGLQSIGNLAFGGCSSLESIKIPASVTSIGLGAFSYSTALKELHLPENVTTIGKSVFEGCSALAAIYCDAESKPEGWDDGWLDGCTATVYFKGQWDYIDGKPHVHSIAVLPAVDPTCEQTGLTEGSHCAICGKIFEEQQTIPALGGEHAFDDSGTCTRCGDDEPISFTLENGLLTITGKGALVPDENGAYPWDALKEQITAIVIGDNITSIGESAFARCANLESITFGKQVTTIEKDAMAYCPKLKTLFFGATVTHLGQGTVWGSTALTDITLTGQTKEDFLAIALLRPYNTPYESESISWHTNCAHVAVTDAAVAPTCTETGLTEGSHCSLCGDVFTAQTVVPATGHAYNDESICTGCGEDEPISWTLEDGVLTVRGKGALVADSEGTYPWNAQKSLITKVIVTGGITEIGAHAFTYCDNIESISFGAFVTTLNNDAMSYCPKLNEVIFHCPISYIGQGIVWSSNAITAITLTEQSVESFLTLAAVRPYNTAFQNESIVWTIVCDHTPVTDPAIAPTCTDIGITEGSHCSICTTVLVAQETIAATGSAHSFTNGNCTKCGIAEGYNWTISAGTLYIRGTGAVSAASEDAYPWHSRRTEITKIIIGDGITEIGARAFTNCKNLGYITFGKNVSKLGMDAMSYCTALSEIVFGGPVTSIGQGVVYGSGNINKITVTGQTKDEFLAIAALYLYNDNFTKDTITWTEA